MTLQALESLCERITLGYNESDLSDAMDYRRSNDEARAMMVMLIETFGIDYDLSLRLYRKHKTGENRMRADWNLALIYYRENSYFKAKYHELHQYLTDTVEQHAAAA